MSIIRKILLKLISLNSSIPEVLHEISLSAMNIGNGSHCSNSGEEWIFPFLSKKWERKKELILFDVGANVGMYSKMLSRIFDSRCRIFAFEPCSKTFELLKKNLSNSNNRILLSNFALGENDHTTIIHYSEEGSGLASLYQRRLDHFNIYMDKKETIKVKRLDDFCNEHNIEYIDFLKLDVEGYELSVLKGCGDFINNGLIDCIQFEFGGCNIDSRTYFQDFWYMLAPKYNIFRILAKGLRPIREYRETQEIFITTNYIAMKKD